MLKALVVTNDFPPRIGGIEEYVAELVRHLPGDVAATVLTSQHPDAASFDRTFPARVIRWGRYPLLPGPGLARAVADHVVREDVSVLVFGATLPLAAMAGTVRRRTGVPIIAFTHGVEPAVAAVPGGAALLRRIAAHTSVMTVLSQWSERRLRAAVGAGVRIELLRSGVDPIRFHPAVDGRPIRAQFGLGRGPIIVSVARLVPRKGHDRIIAALPGVAAEFRDVRLLIVGAGRSRSRLERQAARCAMLDRVVFTGAVSDRDLPACFAAGDVFAMPCRTRWMGLDTEGLGTVFLQAGAVGRPAIAGRSGGAPEAVLDGITGLVVNGKDSTELERALIRLLRSPAEALALAAAGVRRIHRELTWPVLARRLESLLREAAMTDGGRKTVEGRTLEGRGTLSF